MLLLIGFKETELAILKENLAFDLYPISDAARSILLQEVIDNIEQYTGDSLWHEQKFVLMHDLDNEGIKHTLSVFKKLGMRDVIFATTTPTSLSWTLENLLKELIEEHEYFRKQKGR